MTKLVTCAAPIAAALFKIGLTSLFKPAAIFSVTLLTLIDISSPLRAAQAAPIILRRLAVRGHGGRTAAGAKYPSALGCRLAGVLLLAASASAPALANDSSAALSTGGLVFVQNPNVQMRSEQLFISTRQIRVTYHFFNTSDQSVTNLVAFPMPDITFTRDDENISIPTQTPGNIPENFLAFSTTADGRPVAAQVEQKAFGNGIDQTALLRQLNIPLVQTASTDDALDRLPAPEWTRLRDLGLAEIQEEFKYSVGWDMEKHVCCLYRIEPRHLRARWTLKTTYYWQQTFPAHQELAIAHQYKPSVGGNIVSGEDVARANFYPKFCVDPDFLAAASRAQQAATRANKTLFASVIDYILKTGANWAGPIADFTLTIDKGDPANLVSFCGDGVKKIAPTQFQVHYTNFTPTSDLAILILTTNTGAGP
jgi:hypothetical protein